MSRLEFILPELKKKFGGKFYITPAVKLELVDRPLTMHRFQFEALQVMKLIHDGVLEVYNKVPKKKVDDLISLSNSAFEIESSSMDIIQAGEMESVSSASEIGGAVVMDERTLRLLIEDPDSMVELLSNRFHHPVDVNLTNLTEFKKEMQEISIIRSIELVAVAYKMGLLDSYIPDLIGGKELLLGSVLWATKINGCAVTDAEIDNLKEKLIH